ncbi:MAG: carboxypeptidase regulatory-like domain-containing protein [Candidatus Electrothrix sp. AS4_5]|nr:carboxypeptidase regulatory-like domain-containing protein [Candidatus Electrothrix gigas]
MKIRFTYSILTVLFIAFYCFSPTADEAQAGSIKGTVLDKLSNQPIGELTVGLYDQNGNLQQSVLTDTDTGEYLLDNLPDGTYKVVFFTFYTDYIQKWYNSTEDAYSFATAESINVSGTAEEDLSITLEKGAKITGTVEGSNGVELAGVTARIFDIEGNWITSAQATGDDGIYSLTGLNNGHYKIQFRAGDTGYASEWYNDKYTIDTADAVTISSLTDKVRDIELGTSTSISGTVRDSNGVGIVGALVKVYESTGEFVDSPLEFATTGDDGSYTVNGLPANHSFFKVRFFERQGDGSGAGLTEWYDNVGDFASAVTVSADATGVDAVLESSFNWLIFTPVLTHRPSL